MNDKVLEYVVKCRSGLTAGDIWEDVEVFSTQKAAEAYLDELCSESDGCDYKVISRAKATTEDEDPDAGQFDIVCEGRTKNGMEFQIVTDNQHAYRGYGFAVDIWPCFKEDYTQYKWDYDSFRAVIDLIESEYSKDKDKLKLLKVGEYALIRGLDKPESVIIQVVDIDKDTITYRVPGVCGTHAGGIASINPLSATVIPWTSEELGNCVGSCFRVKNITYMATGYDGNLDVLLIPKVVGVDRVTADDLIMGDYEIKTNEGWKPCYNVKWEE